jgi:hypothetical protein
VNQEPLSTPEKRRGKKGGAAIQVNRISAEARRKAWWKRPLKVRWRLKVLGARQGAPSMRNLLLQQVDFLHCEIEEAIDAVVQFGFGVGESTR